MHPPPYLLDQHALGIESQAVVDHLPCEECQAYLLSVAPTTSTIPEALLDRMPATVHRRTPFIPSRWAVVMAAVAACALFVVWGSSNSNGPYVGTKGAPEVVVWVKSANATHRWNGAALQRGDSIRIELSSACETVQVESTDGILFAGECPSGPLPVSWTLDDDPAAEELVVFTNGDRARALTISIPKVIP